MIRNVIKTLIAIGLAAAIALPLHAQTYKAGSTPTGVPFTFFDTKTNSIQGAIVDIAQAMRRIRT